MTDDNDSREGKLARRHKAAIKTVLEELVEAMEDARRDGFTPEFVVNRYEEGGFYLSPEFPTITKRW